MLASVLSVAGISRMVRVVLPDPADARARSVPRFIAWLAAACFALNPNVIYLQATAMTEPVYLTFFIWTVVFFSQALRACRSGDSSLANKALVRAGLCLASASLTRYDAWFLSVPCASH